ncbi:hypothetical protein ISR92_03800 [Patescibacteria group bacterium]|nr:hypothetical protein [Patescibacteria group bacterium]
MKKEENLILGVTQAAEIQRAARKVGYRPEDLKQLSDAKKMVKILFYLRGLAEIESGPQVFNRLDQLKVPENLSVFRNGNSIDEAGIDSPPILPESYELFLLGSQNTGNGIDGRELRKVLMKRQCMDANYLFYMLEHQEIIPESFDGYSIFFWGTILMGGKPGRQYVPYMFRYKGEIEWRAGYKETNDHFWPHEPALLFDW